MSITFSTCWYNFNCKFDESVYKAWMDNMLSNVNNYNLVIYCDYASYADFQKYIDNPRIMVIVKPHNQFYNYRYRSEWINNHEKNFLLNQKVDWKVNMLWSEKIHFVNDTVKNKYFDTEFYGWCDIGYFRGRPNDLSKSELTNWPNPEKIAALNPEKIYYACVNNDHDYMKMLTYIINDKNENLLPAMPIPAHQISIAGGFFICHVDKVAWWRDTLDAKLALYFKHGYLVKDDQIIVVDCILSNLKHFSLCKECDERYDNWFLFQRLLL